MQTLFIAFFLIISAFAHAAIPGATCIGDSSAPVQAIYLHGLFAANGAKDVSGFRALEFANREALKTLAAHFHVRIAVPLAPQVSKSGMREWNSASLYEIEGLAEHACGHSLADHRSLIGFSNGGFKARDIGHLACSKTTDYKRILAIGTQAAYASTCDGRFVNVAPHVFPPAGLNNLSGL